MSSAKKRSTRSGSLGQRRRLQGAKARFGEVVRKARQRGPQRDALHGKDAVVAGADQLDRLQRPMTGRDIVTVLGACPLSGLKFDRLTINAKVRNIIL